MKIFNTILLSILALTAFSQNLSEKEIKKFKAAEKVLNKNVVQFKNDSLPFEERVQLIHDFIPKFVAILKEPNSFNFPFDSIPSIMKVYAPDNSFRIFTWQLKEPLGTHKYYGAIQMNTEKLKLFPLFDYSDTMTVHPQEILSSNNWFGAIYYNCIQNEVNGKQYYSLFGFDEADFVSDVKIMEILSFNNEGSPVFGAPLISYTDSNNVTTIKNRLFIEYDQKASINLNFNEEKNRIVFDHVVPPTEKQKDAWFTYIPDGTYEGFEWKNNQWTWIEKMFHYSIGEPDSPPMPHPILDDRD